jgi:hypothetical protein
VNPLTKQWRSVINERKTVDHAQNILDGELIESFREFVYFFSTSEMGGEVIVNYNETDSQAHYKFAYMEPLICTVLWPSSISFLVIANFSLEFSERSVYKRKARPNRGFKKEYLPSKTQNPINFSIHSL